jgi:hypothetical protein
MIEVMQREIPLRRWWGRSTRTCVAWFAMLTLALPGFASVCGLCCEPGLAKGSDCCASEMRTPGMKMPGMNSSQMESMNGAPLSANHWVAVTATRCAPDSDSEIPEFAVRSEGVFDGSFLLARDFHSAIAWNWGADLFSSVNSAVPLVEETPPRSLLSHPFSFVLRI